MRLSAFLLVAAALVTGGCKDAPTAPGLPLQFTMSPPPEGIVPAPAITASGDVVTAEALLGVSGCDDYYASAGMVRGAMVISFTGRTTDRRCLAFSSPALFRAVVSEAPPGAYDVIVRERKVDRDGRESWSREIARSQVVLP